MTKDDPGIGQHPMIDKIVIPHRDGYVFFHIIKTHQIHSFIERIVFNIAIILRGVVDDSNDLNVGVHFKRPIIIPVHTREPLYGFYDNAAGSREDSRKPRHHHLQASRQYHRPQTYSNDASDNTAHGMPQVLNGL